MNSIRCSQCKHYIEANAGEGKIYGCDRSKCVFESTTKNNLGVDCVSRTLVQSAISKSIEYKENPYQLYKRIESLPSVTSLSSGLEKNSKELDCISRERLKQIVFNITAEYDTETIHIDRLIDEIDNMPPVTPIRPKGHWIGHGEHCRNLGVTPSGLGAYEWCSNCDCGIDVREWHRNSYNYCPNCGADMSEVEE